MNIRILTAAAMLAAAATAPARVDVRWQCVGNSLDAEGHAQYVQRLIVSGDMSRLSRLAFNHVPWKMQALHPADTLGCIIPGYYYVASPRFAAAAPGDTVVVDILTRGTLPNKTHAIVAAHGVDASGRPFDVDFAQLSMMERPEQWSVPGGEDRMPYGPEVYDLNERLRAGSAGSPFDMVPAFKSVRFEGEGVFDASRARVRDSIIFHANPEFYRLRIAPSGVLIEGASPAAVASARRILARLLAQNDGRLPAAVAEAWPDFPYRGLMIDVVRNYKSPAQMRRILGLMADYGLNRLQFHLADDEAWRLEIPGLPELTDYASRRGYTTDESSHLAGIYFGNGDPADTLGTANGFLTRREFISLLQYADSLGIAVIPEIESPGHARAAVKAMEHRYRLTGDTTYRLREDGDTSRYYSAQFFTDNVLNPALPGPYRFMDKVFDEIIAMYAEAGVPLTAINIGGDEVPHGAWGGSPAAARFKAEKGLHSVSDLHAWWVGRMADALQRRGLKVAGWQDIAMGKDERFARDVAPKVEYINLWITWGNDSVAPGVRAQQLGLPVLLSTARGYYFDQAYSGHPEENGLWWAALTDEFDALDTYPRRLAPHVEGGRVVGVQGQLFAETLNSDVRMEEYLFPKMFGMVERGWNADSTYSHPDFNAVVGTRELPYLQRRGVNFHMRQPGVKIDAAGTVRMNSPYPGGEIRYTTDGTDPTPDSALYTAPFALPAGTRQIRARLYHLGRTSVATLLPVKQ